MKLEQIDLRSYDALALYLSFKLTFNRNYFATRLVNYVLETPITSKAPIVVIEVNSKDMTNWCIYSNNQLVKTLVGSEIGTFYYRLAKAMNIKEIFVGNDSMPIDALLPL